jgi:arylsulfatase A-like enzyme
MRTIFILMDSLNRHLLPVYNSQSSVIAPNITRLAEKGLVFDNHYCASMPCMPARRDLMTGRYTFLESSWGPMEPWDHALPVELRSRKGTYSHMITDHYHYISHPGGEGYHCLFDSYEFIRGQEGDAWHGEVKAPEIPSTRGKSVLRRSYWANRQNRNLENEETYSSVQCYRHAQDFVERNHGEDNWLLHLECFDPHEPFDCTREYLNMYDDDWDGELYNWPAYSPLEKADTPAAVAHIRKRYAGSLTMSDNALGKLLDTLDAHQMWKDTCVILTTDHGHLLGEHGYWAKNYQFDYQELVHIPLIIYHPEMGSGRRDGLSSAIDVPQTIMEIMGASGIPNGQGRSLIPLCAGEPWKNRDILYGYHGKTMNMTDGTHTYHRHSLPGSTVYHHTLVCSNIKVSPKADAVKRAEFGQYLPHAGMPMLRFPRKTGTPHGSDGRDELFNVTKDPDQKSPVIDNAMMASFESRLNVALKEAHAPDWQFSRLGIESRF